MQHGIDDDRGRVDVERQRQRTVRIGGDAAHRRAVVREVLSLRQPPQQAAVAEDIITAGSAVAGDGNRRAVIVAKSGVKRIQLGVSDRDIAVYHHRAAIFGIGGSAVQVAEYRRGIGGRGYRRAVARRQAARGSPQRQRIGAAAVGVLDNEAGVGGNTTGGRQRHRRAAGVLIAGGDRQAVDGAVNGAVVRIGHREHDIGGVILIHHAIGIYRLHDRHRAETGALPILNGDGHRLGGKNQPCCDHIRIN